MKKGLKTFLTLLFALMSISAFSQENATVVISYMKVPPGFAGEYLELEKEWKDIHQARLDKGFITGWQLWQKMYSGAEDEYQYISVDWYKNFQSTQENGSVELLKETHTDEEIEELLALKMSAGMAVRKEVMHLASRTENYDFTSYMVVSPMKTNPGRDADYLKMEREIFKPVHEEAVRLGMMSRWSIWYKWPFAENEYRYLAINGFKDFSQLSTFDYGELFEKVHPELDMNEVWKEAPEIRKNSAVEIWRLVDSVYPEGGNQ